MTLVAVTVAVLLLGVPLAVFGGLMIWDSERSTLDLRTSTVVRAVERRLANNDELDDAMLEPFVDGMVNLEARIVVHDAAGNRFAAGPELEGRVLRTHQVTPSLATMRMEVDVSEVQWMVARVVGLVVVAALLAFGVSILVARAQARRLAAPLIYLAASAEQIGSGQVRPQLRKSGIEEIDLVAAELTRTGERLAARLAAERQFAADASHQLRTPLAALSMRLEEIQAIAKDPEVVEEARISLEQVERLTGVVADLLRNSRKAGGGTTEAVRLGELFAQQAEEWTPTFEAAGRSLQLAEASDLTVLATPGALAQVLSTLLENSLTYGDGTTTVDVKMLYNPVAGAVGHAVAWMFGADPKHRMNDDLLRMKSYLETGKIPRDASEHGRMMPRGTREPLQEPRPLHYLHDEALHALPELLEKLEISRPLLVGHSDGATIALLYAAQQERPLEGAVAIAPHVFVEDVSIEGIRRAGEAFRGGGLAEWIGGYLDGIGGWPVILVIALMTTVIIFFTELASNSATAAAFLPILASVMIGIGENPLLVAIPVAIAASCALMLPVATPPNAIVYGSGVMTIPQMARAGFLLNLACIVVITALTYTLVVFLFGIEFGVVPEWATSAVGGGM